MRLAAPHLDTFTGQHVSSWYAATAGETAPGPRLGGQQLDSEVCILGGGLTGLSAALELAENGTEAVVLEGALAGFGASGRNGGQVLHGFACDAATLQKKLGEERARACWQLTVDAVDALAARVARYRIDCDLGWGHITVAQNAREQRALEQQHASLTRLGYRRHQLLGGAALAAQIASPLYIGGLHDSGCGHLHPLRYTQGLARAAVAQGARLFEHSRAVRIDEDPAGVTVITDEGGRVRARHLLLACNVDIGTLCPGLARRFLPIASHIVATAPLPASLAESLLPQNAAVCDCRHVLNYFRLSADGRLLFGGRLKRRNAGEAAIRAERRAVLAKIFPALAGYPIDYSWGGHIDLGLDKTPQFGRLSRRILYSQGFAGHGVVLAGLAGRLMANACCGDEDGFDLFAAPPARAIPLRGHADDALVRIGLTYYRLCDWLGF